jgi:drug/metabolite transporter (DMT)-like permease
LLSILYGLICAIGWGAADFAGGLASRRTNPYRVLFLAEFSGLVLLFILVLIVGEPIPPLYAWLWSGIASGLGTFGLLMLFHALAEGQMSVAAPVSALLAAAVPVLVGAYSQGLLGPLTYLGFGLALASIWTISQNGERTDWRLTLRVLYKPLLAGIFFGFYFVAIHEATRASFFWPLVSARLAGTLVMLIYAAVVRGPALPDRQVWPLVIFGGMLDVASNAFYVLSAKTGRFDVAAVLSSLYPGSTVILAAILLKERLTRLQGFGILLALGAIVLLTV